MDTPTRDRRVPLAGRFARGLLIFLAGALLGANVLYYLMDTGRVRPPAGPRKRAPGG